MADSAIVMNWGQVIPNRESMGLEVFNQALGFYGKLKEKGEIENFSVYLNTQGSLTEQIGTMIVEGTPEQITNLQGNENYRKLIMKAEHVVSSMSVCHADSGNLVGKRIEELLAVRKDLGIG
jgi:hypothetical protein